MLQLEVALKSVPRALRFSEGAALVAPEQPDSLLEDLVGREAGPSTSWQAARSSSRATLTHRAPVAEAAVGQQVAVAVAAAEA